MGGSGGLCGPDSNGLALEIRGRHPYGYPASIGNAKPHGRICFRCSDTYILSYLVTVVGYPEHTRHQGVSMDLIRMVWCGKHAGASLMGTLHQLATQNRAGVYVFVVKVYYTFYKKLP